MAETATLNYLYMAVHDTAAQPGDWDRHLLRCARCHALDHLFQQLRADLATCRERLAALVEALRPFEPQSYFPWPSVAPAYDAARDWLAAHPAEGGQDGAC